MPAVAKAAAGKASRMGLAAAGNGGGKESRMAVWGCAVGGLGGAGLQMKPSSSRASSDIISIPQGGWKVMSTST